MIQWNNLDLNIKNSNSLNILETVSLSLSHHLLIVFFTDMIIKQLNLSQDWCLFRATCHNANSNIVFKNLLNPISNCGLDIKSSLRHLLHYAMCNTKRYTLLNTLKNIDNKLLDLTKQVLTKTLLFGSNSFDINTNTNILNVTVNLVYLLKDLTNRFFN